MSRDLLPEEKYILDLLKGSLVSEHCTDGSLAIENVDIDKVIKLSKSHAVSSILYAAIEKVLLPEKLAETIIKDTRLTTIKNHRLLFLSRAIQVALKEKGIHSVILKGVATASLYPVPEYRKSGDVDILLLDNEKVDDACNVLQELGLVCNDDQRALHHISFRLSEGIDVELHTMLAEPFDNREINQYLIDVTKECSLETINIWGVEIDVLTTAYNGFELLLHMLQHFLRAGFGLKLLCDWVVFWSRDIQEKEKELYLRLVNDSKIKGFSDIVTKSCIEYLGLQEDYVSFMQLNGIDAKDFMVDVFEAEEFGRSSNNRMVGLRGSNLLDYIREFHHQTCLNNPVASKIVLLLPILWVRTLVVFLVNNRRIRHVSLGDVMSTAKSRGKIIKGLHLFE